MRSRGYLGRCVRVLASGLVVAVISNSCQKSENEPVEKPKTIENHFVDWKTFTFENIKIIYPPFHPLESTLTEMASGYVRSIARVGDLLGGLPPIDTLRVYFYSGYGQGRELTGQEYPYADSNSLHFWLPSFYGPTLMQYLLSRWAPDPPRHTFLKHGLISLFDFSGQNYHASTIGYKNAGTLIPIEKLATDTATNSNLERYQSAEAASLCAFILSDYGPIKLRELYLSNQPFDSSCLQFFGQPIDTIENRWLQFIKLYVPKDSIRD